MKSIKNFIMGYIDAIVASAMAILFLVTAIVWCMRGFYIFTILSMVAFTFFICMSFYSYK